MADLNSKEGTQEWGDPVWAGLGRDPEVKFTANGKAVCTLSLATDDAYTDASRTRQQVHGS